MALQLYLGGSGSGKTHELFKYVIDESIKHPELDYLILVPEQYTLTTQYQLVSMHPKKGILNIDVLSFKRLAHRVFEEVGYSEAKGVIIDDIGKNLILRHMASEHDSELEALSGMLNKLGYISEVKSVISEFMQYGVGDEQLEQLINGTKGRGILYSKLKDIRLLYREFLSYINEKYVTSEEILQKVCDVVPKSKKLRKSVIVLDGYTGFTPVQMRLLEELLKNCVDVYATVLIDINNCGLKDGYIDFSKDGLLEQELFYMSKKTINGLNRLCENTEVLRKPDVLLGGNIPARFNYDKEGKVLADDNRKKQLIHLEKNLFRIKEEVYSGDSRRNDIYIFTGKNPNEEAVEAAVRIERLIREEGYHYRDIAVVSGDIATYTNACSRAFTRYDIPFFVDKTMPVLLNPMIEYIRSVFDILMNDFSYEAVFRYLRSSLNDFSHEEVDRLENYVLMYGIKGRKQWGEKFLRKKESISVEELENINSIREHISNSFSEFITDVYGDEGLTSEVDVRVISKALYGFLVRNDVQNRINKHKLIFEEREDLVKAKEYSQIYEEVMELLDKMVELLPGEKVTLKEYSELLDAGFSEIRTGVIPKTNDYVQIGDITRTRLRDIKALFFMGVNDGIIPASNGGSGIISDMDREFLKDNDNGIELAPTKRMQSYTQRLYLYMLVTKPSNKLYMSYSAMSEGGDSLNPSYLIKTINKMFPMVKTEYSSDSLSDYVYGEKSGIYELVARLQDKLDSGNVAEDMEFKTLLKAISDNENYKDIVRILADSAFTTGIFERKDAISRAVANVLYGNELTCSITRLENYARCAYSHFLKYGLRLHERELFSFEASDLGSIFHDTLECFAELISERNLSWFDITEEESEALIEEAINRCIGKEDYSAIYGSFRTKYTINRMKRITKRTVDTLTYQLRKGSFIPRDFEFSFSSTNDFKSLNIELSEDERIRLMGRIDRLDICENDKNVYVKVIDYKSGNKKFDLAAIYMGLDLQLVVYMNAAVETVMKKEEKSRSGREVIPAGILYYHIDDPLIDVKKEDDLSEDGINDSILKKLKMVGLVNSDEKIIRLMDSEFESKSEIIPVALKKDGSFTKASSVASTEEFKILSDYVNYKIAGMGKEIFDGNIKIEPHKVNPKDDTPCKYCDYANICGYRGSGVYEADETDTEDEFTDTSESGNEIIDKMKKCIAK